VIGPRDPKIAGETQAQVVFNPDQMTDQALHVQSAQHWAMPDFLAQQAQRPVERIGRPAERLIRADQGDLRHGATRCPRLPRGPKHSLSQASWEQGQIRFDRGHDDSSNCRSSTDSSFASASRNLDFAVPSGMPAACAT